MSKKQKYKPEFCDMLIEHCQQGYDIASFCGKIMVSRAVLYQWFDKYEEFKAARDIGKANLSMLAMERMIEFSEGRQQKGASWQAALWLAERHCEKNIVEDYQPVKKDEVKVIKTTYMIEDLDDEKEDVEAEYKEIPQTTEAKVE